MLTNRRDYISTKGKVNTEARSLDNLPRASPSDSAVKNLLPMQEMSVQSLDQEDPLE